MILHFFFGLNRCATGEAWPSIMLSCEPPKPCEPRSMINYTLTHIESNFMAEAVRSSSYNLVDWGASEVNLHGIDTPRVLASSGKLTGAREKEVADLNESKTYSSP